MAWHFAVVRAFNPLEKERPAEYAIRLSKTAIQMPQGSLVVAATALRAGCAAMIEPKIGKGGEVRNVQPPNANAPNSRKGRQTVILRLDAEAILPMLAARTLGAADQASTRTARAFLLTQLSASPSRKNDAFQARLAEPVRIGDKLFEEGSLVDGRVSPTSAPRMLSPAGSLHLHIDRITSPEGVSIAIAGTLGGVEVEPGMKYALDDEGGLPGLKPGFANAIVDFEHRLCAGQDYGRHCGDPDSRDWSGHERRSSCQSGAVLWARSVGSISGYAAWARRYLPRYSEIEIAFGRLGERASSPASLQP